MITTTTAPAHVRCASTDRAPNPDDDDPPDLVRFHVGNKYFVAHTNGTRAAYEALLAEVDRVFDFQGSERVIALNKLLREGEGYTVRYEAGANWADPRRYVHPSQPPRLVAGYRLADCGP